MSIADSLDPIALIGAELAEEAVEARLAPLIGEVLDRAGSKVRHHGDVVLAPTCCLLVDAHHGRNHERLGRKSSGDRTVHEMPRLVPAEPQQPGGTFDIALSQHVDSEPLEQHGEAAHRLGPRQRHLAHPVGGALDARWPCVQVGEERAAVEVPPGAFLAMVVDGELEGHTPGR